MEKYNVIHVIDITALKKALMTELTRVIRQINIKQPAKINNQNDLLDVTNVS